MPVTTRKQLLSAQQTKIVPSSALPVVNNNIKKNTIALDHLKNSKVSVEKPTIEITGMANIEYSDYEDFRFDGTSFYESFEPTIKSNGLCGQNIDLFTDMQREEKLAFLQNNQERVALALYEQSTCLLSPPMTEYDPCSPVARSRSASTDIMVPSSPYENVSTPADQHAALDILDEIIGSQVTSQAVECFNPIQSQDVLCELDEIINSTSQEPSTFDLDDVLDFISSQQEAPREMWTQEETSLKAAVSTQESYSSQAFPSLSMTIGNQVAAPEIDEETINEFLSVLESQSTCASPAQSIDSSYSTANSASPVHSVTSDEEYLPIAELKRKNGLGGNKRGRKRKNDGEFGEERKVDKKLKNAEAAARYRQKKKEEDAKANEELEKASAALAKTRETFNTVLKKRNLMLQMFHEEAKKSGIVRIPSWIDSYLKKHEI